MGSNGAAAGVEESFSTARHSTGGFIRFFRSQTKGSKGQSKEGERQKRRESEGAFRLAVELRLKLGMQAAACGVERPAFSRA
eukprot:365706-Chlamydomonas_euryale.AAC.11